MSGVSWQLLNLTARSFWWEVAGNSLELLAQLREGTLIADPALPRESRSL